MAETYKFLGKYPYLTPLSVTSNESTLTFDSLNLRRKVVKKNAQRFEFSITVSGGRSDSLHADLLSNWLIKGASVPFTIPVPQPIFTNDRTAIATTVNVSTSYAVGITNVTVSSGGAYSIPAGRFIKFSNHDKVYVSTTSISDNTQTLTISPPLVSPITNIVTVLAFDVQVAVYNEPDNSVFTYESGVIQTATLKFIEALN